MKNCKQHETISKPTGMFVLYEQLEEALEERQLSDRRNPANALRYVVEVERRKGPRRKEDRLKAARSRLRTV